MNSPNVQILVGLTLAKFEIDRMENTISIEDITGRQFKFWHDQDCCESVSIQWVEGDIRNILGTPLLSLSEQINNQGAKDGSETRTTQVFRSDQGAVLIDWLGKSNGCYSESVSFIESDR